MESFWAKNPYERVENLVTSLNNVFATYLSRLLDPSREIEAERC